MSGLKGKKALVLGVANNRSFAWAVAKKLHEAGAIVGLTYGDLSNQKRAVPLGEEISAAFTVMCNVSLDEDLAHLKKTVQENFGEFDILVHSIGFAPPDELAAPLFQASKIGFLKTMDISAYSLINIINTLKPFLKKDSSILTMTNHGSQKVVPGYGLMGVAKAALEASVRYLAYDLGSEGIRVNAVSAGPVKTMSAMGVGNFDDYLNLVEESSPLRRNISADDVADLAVFLCSDQARNITGAVQYIDAGISIMGA